MFVQQSAAKETSDIFVACFLVVESMLNLCQNPAIKLNIKVTPKRKFENHSRDLPPQHAENLPTKSTQTVDIAKYVIIYIYICIYMFNIYIYIYIYIIYIYICNALVIPYHKLVLAVTSKSRGSSCSRLSNRKIKDLYQKSIKSEAFRL